MSNLTIDEMKKLAADNEIDTVLAVFPDSLGRLMGKRMTASFFLESQHFYCCDYLLSAGMEMEPQPGFEIAGWEKGYGDFIFVPDLRTLRRIPWLTKTALVICDLCRENSRPVAQSPRSILSRQCEQLARRGMQAYLGSELEFHLFRNTYAQIRQSQYQELLPSSPYRIDYHILHTTFDEPIIRAIRNGMVGADIPVESSKGECGNGQYEIGLCYAPALEMADRHVIYKNGAKEIAALNNAAITFMAKYSTTEAGSSFHIHSNIFELDTDNNLFWDSKADKPSSTFRYFLGGLMQLSREFFLFFAPTVNAYKRYREKSFAPTRIAWARDNRTAGYRIVGNSRSFRIENRMPGADANPYLAFAATLAAGMYGIENKIECPEELVGSAYSADNWPRIPCCLSEAIDLFAQSSAARLLFGADVVEHYLHSARLEQQSFHKAVTNWELNRYFERI